MKTEKSNNFFEWFSSQWYFWIIIGIWIIILVESIFLTGIDNINSMEQAGSITGSILGTIVFPTLLGMYIYWKIYVTKNKKTNNRHPNSNSGYPSLSVYLN